MIFIRTRQVLFKSIGYFFKRQHAGQIIYLKEITIIKFTLSHSYLYLSLQIPNKIFIKKQMKAKILKAYFFIFIGFRFHYFGIRVGPLGT